MKNNKAKLVAVVGLLCALSVAISFLESLIPPIIPVPGVKPGFSNIVTMFAVSFFGPLYGLLITFFKAFFALLTRGSTAFFMSLCGGLLSLLILTILFKLSKTKIGYIGIGVLSAVFHNLGQFIVAFIILGKTIVTILPLLVLSGVLCGILTGTIFKLTLPHLERSLNSLSKHLK